MYASRTTKPRSRILNIQKKNLVNLVRNFFVRTHGHYSNVNFDEINLAQWGRIATLLNNLGPSKSVDQWKNSFYFMTNRIRNKVELIEQCGANPRDNLSDVDYIIYVMLPPNSYIHDDGFDDPDSNASYNENGEMTVGDITANGMSFDVDNNDEIPKHHQSTTTVVIETPEELDEYMAESMIEERELSLDGDGEFNNEDLVEEEGQMTETTEISAVKPSKTPKTGVRITEVQKERLVQLVQNNFLKAVGQFAGANGKFIKSNLWNTFAKELNTLGPPRTAEQWKATLHSIKAGAKAKIADEHNESTKTKNLSRLEEKIVSIYGMDNMDGHQSLGESGFGYSKTVPKAPQCDRNIEEVEWEREALSETLEETCEESVSRPPSQASLMSLGTGSRGTGIIFRTEKEFTPRTEVVPNSRVKGFSTRPGVVVSSRPSGLVKPRSGGDSVSRADIATSRAEGVVNLHSKSTTVSNAINRVHSSGLSPPHEGTVLDDAEVLREIIEEIRNESNDKDASLQANERNVPRPSSRASSMSMGVFGTVSRGAGITSLTEKEFTSRAEGTCTSRTERVPNLRGVSTTSPGVVVTSRPGIGNSRFGAVVSSRQGGFGNSQPGGIGNSQPGGIGNSLSGGVINTTSRQQSSRSSFAPPRLRRTKRSHSPIEYITNVNQFFNDGDESDSSERRSIRTDRNIATVGNKSRDRSNLRNKHTSHEMVQQSMSAQERFIDDSNRNHSELMYLIDRNHSEMFGAYTSTLSALVDVSREFLNRM